MLRTFSLSLLCCLLLSACSNDKTRYFEKNIDIENGSWTRDTIPELTFEIKDTSLQYHLIYNIRNSVNYSFYNIYLESELKDSSGKKVNTFFKELYLFDDEGKPYGEGNNFLNNSLGDIFDGRYMCQPYYKFPYAGKYTFSFKQYMRDQDPLDNILAIGLRIETPDLKSN